MITSCADWQMMSIFYFIRSPNGQKGTLRFLKESAHFCGYIFYFFSMVLSTLHVVPDSDSSVAFVVPFACTANKTLEMAAFTH